jgi:hypothetical protein
LNADRAYLQCFGPGVILDVPDVIVVLCSWFV